MTENLIIQGRRLSQLDLQSIRQWMKENPDWSRWRLSRELATRWDWRNGAGRLKDMASRTLLVKLEQRGLIGLPPRRQVPTNRMRCGAPRQDGAKSQPAPITCTLEALGDLKVHEVSQQKAERAWIRRVLGQFHYLGFGGAVGENLQYVLSDGREQPLACLVFGAAAWKCQDRDRFIGWSAEQRTRNLGLIANNSRCLIVPWVRVPLLGSWILGQVSRRLSQDWQSKYGHQIVLLETFVERERFRGTIYRAANWQRVGVTAGRTRQDRYTRLEVPIKEIYLYPMSGDFRKALRA